MESSNLNTSSIRDKWHCWKSRTKSERRNVSSIATVTIGWNGGLILWNAVANCELSKTSWQTGKAPYERRFGEPFKGPIIPFEQCLNIIRFQHVINQDFINLASTFYQESFLGMHWSRREFGKGIFWLRIWKNWKSGTHQKFILGESTRKKYSYHRREKNSYSQLQVVKQNCQEVTTNSEKPLWDGNKRKERRSQWRTSKRTGRVPTDRIKKVTLKPVPTSGRSKGGFLYRHHDEPRVQLFVPKEETFSTPLKYIDVTRSTHTDLDVMQEKRVDD